MIMMIASFLQLIVPFLLVTMILISERKKSFVYQRIKVANVVPHKDHSQKEFDYTPVTN